MKQKVIVIGGIKDLLEFNKTVNEKLDPLLSDGYLIKTITPLSVSVSLNTSLGSTYREVEHAHGRVIFLLEKPLAS